MRTSTRRSTAGATWPGPSGPDVGPALTRRVERCIGWIKESRRVATRYEKLAVNYLVMLKLAMMRRYFSVLADTT